MLTGRNIRPDKAKKMKLVDVAVDPVGKVLFVKNQERGFWHYKNRNICSIVVASSMFSFCQVLGFLTHRPEQRSISRKSQLKEPRMLLLFVQVNLSIVMLLVSAGFLQKLQSVPLLNWFFCLCVSARKKTFMQGLLSKYFFFNFIWNKIRLCISLTRWGYWLCMNKQTDLMFRVLS